MKYALVFVFFAATIGYLKAEPQWNRVYTPPFPYGYVYEPLCPAEVSPKVAQEFTNAIYKPATYLFKKAAALSDDHFIFSPFTIWMTLAAIAEGSEEFLQRRINYFLNLPDDKCERQMYYKLAAGKEISNNEVSLQRIQQFILDSNVRVNPLWEKYVKANNLIDVSSAPYKAFPVREIQNFRNLISAQLPNLNLNGNAIILESLDYNGLWTKAFSDAIIQTGPFYNSFGQELGSIEYMKSRMIVKIAYIPRLNMKVAEIPVGSDERYRMLIGIPLGSTVVTKTVVDLQSSIVFETLSNLKETPKPIDVVIPRMIMSSEIDVRRLVEDLDVNSFWTSPFATRNISDPAAIPSSYFQRVTATFNNAGIISSIQRFSNIVPPLPQRYQYNATYDPIYTTDFVANRPFLFGLINTDNYLGSFAGAFSKIHFGDQQ